MQLNYSWSRTNPASLSVHVTFPHLSFSLFQHPPAGLSSRVADIRMSDSNPYPPEPKAGAPFCTQGSSGGGLADDDTWEFLFFLLFLYMWMSRSAAHCLMWEGSVQEAFIKLATCVEIAFCVKRNTGFWSSGYTDCWCILLYCIMLSPCEKK
jgi:hypothetical protein